MATGRECDGAQWGVGVIWLFERGDEVLRLETRREDDEGAYVLIIQWANRASETETYADFESYQARLLALEKRLEAENWTQLGGPRVPSDWRGPIH
jgi:hypothetical protein